LLLLPPKELFGWVLLLLLLLLLCRLWPFMMRITNKNCLTKSHFKVSLPNNVSKFDVFDSSPSSFLSSLKDVFLLLQQNTVE
jgi:hypothetical protein